MKVYDNKKTNIQQEIRTHSTHKKKGASNHRGLQWDLHSTLSHSHALKLWSTQKSIFLDGRRAKGNNIKYIWELVLWRLLPPNSITSSRSRPLATDRTAWASKMDERMSCTTPACRHPTVALTSSTLSSSELAHGEGTWSAEALLAAGVLLVDGWGRDRLESWKWA